MRRESAFAPKDPAFQKRTRDSFARQAGVLTVEFKINLLAAADGERAVAVGEVIRSGRTLTVCRLDAYVEKSGKRTHCATGMQTLMTITGRAGVRD